tara:strand:- start:961 stop:2310 length:1350 start_codon:yes stop_codon:yes gene_type:complete
MSVENNSARSIDGLNRIVCDIIDVSESIQIDGDNGEPNQIITSDGTESKWSSISELLQNLTISSPLSFVSGSNYNGSIAREIQIADGAIGNVKLEHSTISGKSLGTNLSTATFSAPLTATTFNGSSDSSITIADGAITNAKLENDTISGKALGTNLSTLTFTSPLTSTTYNGTGTASVGIADGDIGIAKLEQNTISGVSLGNNLANLDTGGYGISLTGSYNGGTARTISLSINPYGGLTADGSGLALTNNSFTIGDTTVYLGGTATDLDMDDGNLDNAIIEDSNLLSISNKIIPPNVYVNAGQYVMPFNAGIFHPNDDSSYYNYCLDDDGTKTSGRGMIKTASLEVLGVIHIPRGWTATGTFLDIRDSSGNVISYSAPTYDVYKIQTTKSGGTIDSRVSLGGGSINTENAFSGAQTFTGVYNYEILIDIHMTSTSHFIGGGYILLNAPS